MIDDVGGPAAVEALLKKAVTAPGAPRPFVEQAAAALAITGDVSVDDLRRELPRAERNPVCRRVVRRRVPSSPPCRAYVLSADGKHDEAIAAMQSILSEDIRQVSTSLNLGQVQDRGGRTDDAIASYRRVVDAAPVSA